MQTTNTIAPAGLLLLAVACASSQGEEVRDARMAAVDANAEAKREKIDDGQSARADRIEQHYDERKDRIDARDRPAEDANERLVEVSERRAQYASQAVARLNKLSVRINAAQQKINVLGHRAPTELQTNLDTTAKQYDLVKSDVLKLNSTPPSGWDATKQHIDEQLSKLDERVSELDESIGDV